MKYETRAKRLSCQCSVGKRHVPCGRLVVDYHECPSSLLANSESTHIIVSRHLNSLHEGSIIIDVFDGGINFWECTRTELGLIKLPICLSPMHITAKQAFKWLIMIWLPSTSINKAVDPPGRGYAVELITPLPYGSTRTSGIWSQNLQTLLSLNTTKPIQKLSNLIMKIVGTLL